MTQSCTIWGKRGSPGMNHSCQVHTASSSGVCVRAETEQRQKISVNDLNTWFRDEREDETPLSWADAALDAAEVTQDFCPQEREHSKASGSSEQELQRGQDKHCTHCSEVTTAWLRASTSLQRVWPPKKHPAGQERISKGNKGRKAGCGFSGHHGLHVIGANTSNFSPSGKSFLQFWVILNYIPSFHVGFSHSKTCCPLTTGTRTAGIFNLLFYSIFYFVSFF